MSLNPTKINAKIARLISQPRCFFGRNIQTACSPTHGIPMKITTWNVNSLNVRLPQVQNWLAEHQPDVLVLQELKLDQDKYPAAALQMMGWHTV